MGHLYTEYAKHVELLLLYFLQVCTHTSILSTAVTATAHTVRSSTNGQYEVLLPCVLSHFFTTVFKMYRPDLIKQCRDCMTPQTGYQIAKLSIYEDHFWVKRWQPIGVVL